MRGSLPIIIITALGLLLRCLTADWSSLSADEANGVAIATTGSWLDLFQHLREDGNPPLHYVLIRLSSQLIGSSDIAFRLLNIGISASLAPIVYWTLRSDRVLALQAASLTALCPTLIRFGNMVRMYSLLPILSFASTFCAIKLMHEPRNRALWIAYPILAAMLIYCHHWGFFVLLGQAGLALWGMCKGWWSFRTLLPWWLGLATAALAYLLWVPSLYYSLTHDVSPWAYAPPPSSLLLDTPPQALIGELIPTRGWESGEMIYATLWFLFLFILPGFEVDSRSMASWGSPAGQKAPVRSIVACLRYVVMAGLIGALLVCSIRPGWRDRYVMSFTPLLLVVFCLMLHRFLPRKHLLLACCLPALLWLPTWLPEYWLLSQGRESGVGAIATKIKQEINPATDLVVVSYEVAAPAINHLLPENVTSISFPDMKRVTIVKWDRLNQRMREDTRMYELIKRLQRVLEQGGTVWLVDAARSTSLSGEPGDFTLGRFDFRQVEAIRMDQIRNWLRTHAQQQDVFLWGPGRDLSLYLSVYKPKAAGGVSTPPPQQLP